MLGLAGHHGGEVGALRAMQDKGDGLGLDTSLGHSKMRENENKPTPHTKMKVIWGIKNTGW